MTMRPMMPFGRSAGWSVRLTTQMFPAGDLSALDCAVTGVPTDARLQTLRRLFPSCLTGRSLSTSR
jgi:hypothetical protein